MKSERGKKRGGRERRKKERGGKKAKIPSWRTKGLRGNGFGFVALVDNHGFIGIVDVESIVGIFLTFLQSFATCIDDV